MAAIAERVLMKEEAAWANVTTKIVEKKGEGGEVAGHLLTVNWIAGEGNEISRRANGAGRARKGIGIREASLSFLKLGIGKAGEAIDPMSGESSGDRGGGNKTKGSIRHGGWMTTPVIR